MNNIKPKYVKKAGSWCVTYVVGEKQTRKYFGTEKEALEFIKELKK